ncbi:MAG: lysine transporter LysE [Rhodospirillales bacterium 20-64-7]|nr:MAG: lysine transporter LysE [Rhodospirillales bacterium 20-64-7]HQT79186.1 LysE family translocator [Rhodopila sp.]
MTPGLSLGLLLASALAGAAYTLAPGPAFLALLGIGASKGRRAGAAFLCGHFAGDVLWASLSLTAVIGARTIGTLFFDLLGLLCGTYLCWLGFKSATARRGADGAITTEPRRALLRGLAFGLSNPKAYPVAVAMFTALLAQYARTLSWSAFPSLLAAACVGFITADIILVSVIGAGVVRRFYRRHALWVTRVSGVLFLGFGAHAIATASPGLWRRL